MTRASYRVQSPTEGLVGGLAERLAGPAYQGYAYGYPHKTAYRALSPPRELREVWRSGAHFASRIAAGQPDAQSDTRDAPIELYVHIPFCSMRCGFCNLFTTVDAANGIVPRLLAQLEVEALEAASAVAGRRIAHIAIGGGTPTFLRAAELDRLLVMLGRTLGADPQQAATSVESSPETVTPDKLAVLRRHGVERLSLGVQSFDEAETRALGRPQRRRQVEQALEMIRQASFPVLNIDLIYGAAGQPVASVLASIDAALAWQPGELFLYPLYVRPLTGLGRTGRAPGPEQATVETTDLRLDMYRAGRDCLLDAGVRQISMRCFRKTSAKAPLDACDEAGSHAAASLGSLGLGCGARSTAPALHYSSEYAVGRGGVQAILASYLARDRASFHSAHHGVELSGDDQRRRFVLLSLLQTVGVSRAAYRQRFGGDVLDELPQLAELTAFGLGQIDAECVSLTAAGIERADVVGPWLYAAEVVSRMRSYPWR